MANLRENVYLLSMPSTKRLHRRDALYRTFRILSPLIVIFYPNTAIYCYKIAEINISRHIISLWPFRLFFEFLG